MFNSKSIVVLKVSEKNLLPQNVIQRMVIKLNRIRSNIKACKIIWAFDQMPPSE